MTTILALHPCQYAALSAYGHMGREELGVKWEETNKVEELKKAVE